MDATAISRREAVEDRLLPEPVVPPERVAEIYRDQGAHASDNRSQQPGDPAGDGQYGPDSEREGQRP